MIKANDALEMLVEFQKDIFTKNILKEIENYHNKLVKNGTVEKVISQAQNEVVKTIEELSKFTHSFPANAFFRNVPDNLRLAILLRFQYFEKNLLSSGNEILELPVEFSSFLRYGLIHLWNERESLSPKHRNN